MSRAAVSWRNRWLWWGLLVLVGLVVTIRLGFWQLSRLQERRNLNAELRAGLQTPPIRLTGVPFEPADYVNRPGVVRGVYDPAAEIVLRNQPLSGAPGKHLITPLRIAGSDAAVLVDRGWVPYDQPAENYPAPGGEVEVSGLLRPARLRLNTLSPADKPGEPGAPLKEWFRVDIVAIQAQVPYRLLPIFLEEGVIEPEGAANLSDSPTLPLPHIEVDLSDGPHLSYAFQWFAFAVIMVIGSVALYLRDKA